MNRPLQRGLLAAFGLLLLPAMAICGNVPKAVEAPAGQGITWRLAGPGGGGWIQSMAWDPHDANLLYVGCDVGGFYFSTNAGASYEIRNQGLHDYYLESIAVHPQDSRIIILGTQSGIHRSVDQGKSWAWVRQGFPGLERYRFSAPIGAVTFDPLRPHIVYAGIGRPRWDTSGAGAIYRSDDTGVTWRRVDGGQLPAHAIVSDLKVKPDDSKVVLAATSEGLFRSEDEGKHWMPATNGLPHTYTEEIAFAPSRPQTVYLTLRCTAEGAAPWNGAVCRSDDAGQSWRTVNGEGLPKRVGKQGQARNLSSNPKELAVDPRDPNTVYVGNRDWVSAGVYKTTDGGQHWSQVTRHTSKESNMNYGWITMWGPTVECLALSPAAPDRLAFGTSGHVFLSDDGGTSWRQRYTRQLPDGRFAGTGLEVTCAWRVALDLVRSNRVYGCYMDIGLLISEDLGRTFRRSSEGMKMGGNCFGVVVDPQAPDTLWAATGWWDHNAGDVCRSEDDGRTWRVVGHPESGLPDGQVLEMAIDLKSPLGKRRLLAISKGNGVVETRDGGQTWHSLNGNLPADAVKEPCGLLLDPEDSQHVVIAAGGNLYATRDGGSRWQRLNASGLPPNIQRLVAEPHSFQKLYVAAREHYDRKTGRQYPGGAFRSDDGGQTWRHLLDYRFATDIAISPANARLLYVTTAEHPYFDGPMAQGLLKSTDGGETWHRENNGLSLHNLKAVCVSPHDPGTVFLSTSGNSIFVGHDREVR